VKTFVEPGWLRRVAYRGAGRIEPVDVATRYQWSNQNRPAFPGAG
jgi:hypothetical protein